MRTIIALSVLSAFLGGLAVGLLVSYPVPAHSLFVGIVALFISMTACIIGAWAIVLHATRREWRELEGIVDAVVDALKERRLIRPVED